jgi:GH24 family phage-related lysozyme (muramidase)
MGISLVLGLLLVMLLSGSSSATGNTAQIACSKLKLLEGFKPDKFWDYQQYSIGYGTKWVEGDRSPITRLEAFSLLMGRITTQELPFVQNKLNQAGIHLNNQQQAALISFLFNVGSGGLGSRTWWGRYIIGDMQQARHRFLQWNKVEFPPGSGILIPNLGLTKRRRKEWYWLIRGVYNPSAAFMSENQLPLT